MTSAAAERARVESRLARLFQSRGLVAPSDALHLLRVCARCGAVGRDLRAMHAWLAPDGATAVHTPDALRSLLASLDDALPSPPCRCDDAVGLARYYHAMGRGDLVVERAAGRDGLAVMYLDGAEAMLTSCEETFGRALSTRPGWTVVLDGDGACRVEVEPGHWLLAADHSADVVAPREGTAVLGLDATSLRAPTWRWLVDALGAGRYAGRVLAVAVDPDAVFDALARALARTGARLTRAEDAGRWRALRDEVRRDVEVGAALQEIVRRDVPLSAFALRLAAELSLRLDDTARYVAAARASRPEATLRVDGDRLLGPSGRSLDLRVAAFEDDLAHNLERDLRVLLDEAPPWATPDRVCPCGAARALVPRLLPASTLAALQDEGRTPLVRARLGGAVEVVSAACDRHRAPLTRDELDAWGWRDDALAARVQRDAAEAEFHAQVASWRDDRGRAVLLAQGPDLGSVVLRDGWIRALVALADAPLAPDFAQATSLHALLMWERDADPALIDRARAVDALLDPSGRQDLDALTPVREVSQATPEGRFLRLDAPGAPTAPW